MIGSPVSKEILKELQTALKILISAENVFFGPVRQQADFLKDIFMGKKNVYNIASTIKDWLTYKYTDYLLWHTQLIVCAVKY